jgi:hypothetical protein
MVFQVLLFEKRFKQNGFLKIHHLIELECVNLKHWPTVSSRYTTVSYRSPEMIDLYSNKPITTKSDIWVS